MDGLSLGSDSRNSKTDFNKTLGKKFANFQQLLDEEDLDGKETQEKKIKALCSQPLMREIGSQVPAFVGAPSNWDDECDSDKEDDEATSSDSSDED